MDVKKLIKLFGVLIVICSLISAGITYAIVNDNYKAKNRSEEGLKKEFDSLMVVIAVKNREVNEIRRNFDSVVYVLYNQGREIDSLIRNKEVQKAENEKRYHSIYSMSDGKLNRILSSKLK